MRSRRRRRRRPSIHRPEFRTIVVVVIVVIVVVALEMPLAPLSIPYPPQAHEDEEERPQETRPDQNQWLAEKAVAAVPAREPECVFIMISSAGCPGDRKNPSKHIHTNSENREKLGIGFRIAV